jgi:hypothetical protein
MLLGMLEVILLLVPSALSQQSMPSNILGRCLATQAIFPKPDTFVEGFGLRIVPRRPPLKQSVGVGEKLADALSV